VPAAVVRCSGWPPRSVSPRSATGSGGPAMSMTPETRPTPTSPTTRRPASSVPGACAPAARSRAPSPSPSLAAGSTRGSPPEAPTSCPPSACRVARVCRRARPPRWTEKSVIELGMPYAHRGHHVRLLRRRVLVPRRGAGRGRRHPVVRMVPWKDGGANEGHSCVKGRFAYGYAAHRRPAASPHGPRLGSTSRGAG
jgi:hypothetical protein